MKLNAHHVELMKFGTRCEETNEIQYIMCRNNEIRQSEHGTNELQRSV